MSQDLNDSFGMVRSQGGTGRIGIKLFRFDEGWTTPRRRHTAVVRLLIAPTHHRPDLASRHANACAGACRED